MPISYQPTAVRLERFVFAHRRWLIAAFLLVTAYMAYSVTHLRVDAGFMKLLPLEHEYMDTFVEYHDEFGGANRILVALMAEEGDIFTPEFFEALREATDAIFFLPGVDRARVRSLFTPNVRFTEVVERGISGGNVVPADFQPTAEGLERVRENILKADIVGRLVANDFSGAIVSAELLEVNPKTGQRLDLIDASRKLEQIRERFDNDSIDVHIIGFPQIVGEIAEGARRVALFFAFAILITTLLVYLYAQSFKIAIVPIFCSLVAVLWTLGTLPLLGLGIDPMSLLVPFLVFAIGVSHGVQMISSVGSEVFVGADADHAARGAFRRLVVPGGIALVSDTFGFITILSIQIAVIQEMAIIASLGVAVIILTNLVLLPLLVSYLNLGSEYRRKLHRRAAHMKPVWTRLGRVARRRPAAVVIGIAVVLFGVGTWKGTQVQIGDLHRGVPELRSESTYNVDSRVITQHFSIGVDILSVVTETTPDACVDYDVMTAIDRFGWHMLNVPGVESVAHLPGVVKVINAGWNEGSLKWRILPRNTMAMGQSVRIVPTSSGLLNADCSAMLVYMFTRDHKAETIDRIVTRVKEYRSQNETENLEFRLAGGNVGVMAATNEAVREAQFPILVYVYAAIFVLCALTFRSVLATLCIVIPLTLVSLLTYALMAVLEIGLKVNTLPVVALGVGIGVDYGIYMFSRFQTVAAEGKSIPRAYFRALATTGNGVLLTGLTLSVGVATWIVAPLKFQADMGTLLTFMFVMNMLGALLLLPALASWLLRARYGSKW